MQHHSMRIPLFAALALLGAPASTMAQHAPADRSRILLDQHCSAERNCPPRAGLVWNESNPIPSYPSVMLDFGISGRVVVHFSVRPDGTVDPGSVAVGRASNRSFEAPTVEAVRQWQFRFETRTPPDDPINATLQVLYSLSTNCKGGPRASEYMWAPDGHSMQLIVASGCRVMRPPHGR